MSKLNRGVNLTLEQVSGPGTFSLYLENGNCLGTAGAVVLDQSEPQKLWVEKNTHTHANWDSPPGRVPAEGHRERRAPDSSTVSDTRYLKFAVGDSASADTLY